MAKSILTTISPVLFLLAGCSAAVDITDAPPSSATKTTVAVGFLPAPDAPPDQDARQNRVVVHGDGNIVIASEEFYGCLHPHEAKIGASRSEVDSECERLWREHQERVARWRAELGE